MTTRDDLPLFLTIEEAATLLNVARSTLTQAIDRKKLPAVQLSDTHGGTRIRRSDLFPSDETARDLRLQRIRRHQLIAMDLREQAARKRAEANELQERADAAARLVDHELALHDLETAERRLVAS